MSGSINTTTKNMLAAEIAIIDRLREVITDAKVRIISSANLIGTPNPQDICPAIVVHPLDTPAVAVSDDGERQKETQSWAVIVMTKVTPDTITYKENYQLAGALMQRVVQALAGMKIGDGYRPLKYAGRDAPAPSPGYVEFKLTFNTQFTF